MVSHDVEITKGNEVYLNIISEPAISQEISDHFTFLVPGHAFVPAFRKRFCDGKIRLFNVMNRLLYGGLLPHLCKFLYLREYTVKFKSDFKLDKIELQPEDLPRLPEAVKPREYQITAVNHALSNQRSIFLSPTASVHSLLIYLFVRYLKLNTLLLLPTTS